MIKIGITGGIGTGKSTVANYIREQGFPVIDADALAHEATAKGSPVLQQLAEAFGRDILDGKGNLRRAEMARIAFASPENKAKLESIVTSQVIRDIGRQMEALAASGSPVAFLDAPTLFETGGGRLVDQVWLVTAAEQVRIERAMKRDGCTEEDVRARIRNQMSEEEKRRRSQEIIDNSSDLESLFHQINALIKKHVQTVK